MPPALALDLVPRNTPGTDFLFVDSNVIRVNPKSPRSIESEMHIADAAYAVVHDYPGGAESLAPRLGMSSAVLRNKVNPNNTTHHLTLAEAVRLSEITGNHSVLIAFASALGLVVVELPAPENCADAEIIETLAKTWETAGDVGREVREAFADGRIEQHEVMKVKDRAWTHITTILGLVNRIAGMAEK